MPAAMAQQLPTLRLYDKVPQDKLDTASRQLAAEGLKAMDEKNYTKASGLFNLAVKTDMTNSYLHFLNGVAYQLRGMAGENGLFPLAEQGYQMAVQFDNSNWLARYYGGLLAMYQRDFNRAQKKFAEAALYAPNEPDLLYDLAVVSYYNRDPKTAAAALEGMRKVLGKNAEDPRLLRASAIVAASLNQLDEAKTFVDRLRAAAHGSSDDLQLTESRVAAWAEAFENEGSYILTQAFPAAPAAGGFPAAPAAGAFPGAPAAGGFPGAPGGADPAGGLGGFVEKQMAVVDVVILSTEEDNTNAMGVNLLDGLRIQFGNTTATTPGYSRTSTKSFDKINGANNTDTLAVTRLISMPAVNYSLNIANANAKRDEVLARPTLVALGNKPSSFFSGVDVVGAAVSGGQGSAVQIQKEVGVKLSVTPEFLPDNLIKLNVIAERTFLAIPSNSVKFDFRLDTTKTTVNANVVMKFGETLILSGLSERDQSHDRDGVPLLQDVPIVQYLFSRNVSREYYKSVLILLTPRRAQYTNRADADVAADNAKLTPEDQALVEFENKHRPWFKPIPNIGEITRQLDNSPLYREFRTGDLAASWRRATSHSERLASAVRFLFF
jgi:general secretion pathway protein D